MGGHSIFFSSKNSFCKFLFETQSVFLRCLLILIDLFLINKHVAETRVCPFTKLALYLKPPSYLI